MFYLCISTSMARDRRFRMTTRQFTSFYTAVSIWIVMIYYWLLDNSPFAIHHLELSSGWYWWMLFLGSIPLWIFITDVRQKR